MMPIMAGGIAAIPVTQSNIASAFNNVVRNVSAALGVAGLTATLTIQQTQQLAGRAALVPATTPTPHRGPPGHPRIGWTLGPSTTRPSCRSLSAPLTRLFVRQDLLLGGVAVGRGHRFTELAEDRRV